MTKIPIISLNPPPLAVTLLLRVSEPKSFRCDDPWVVIFWIVRIARIPSNLVPQLPVIDPKNWPVAASASRPSMKLKLHEQKTTILQGPQI